MKELSIEQKAKAYDQVREKIALRFGSNVAEEIFSKFEDSEDGRIRKALIRFHKSTIDVDGIKGDDIVAWLEKQGGKTAWSEDGENRINRLIAYFEDKESFTAEDDVVYANWLKSIKERVQPQSKQDILEKLKEWLDEYVSDLADVDTSSLICSFRNYLDGELPNILCRTRTRID